MRAGHDQPGVLFRQLMTVSMEQLAAAPRWSPERTTALAGQCRGAVLGPWGANLTRRFGNDAVSRVRGRLDAETARVSEAPPTKTWFSVSAQVGLTEAIIDEFLGGDALKLYPLVVDDTRRGSGRAALAVLRGLGPRRMLKLAPRTHRRVYDVGTLEADVHRTHARLTFRGADLFENPTWRLLQLFANRTMFELAGATDAEATGEEIGAQAFGVNLCW